VGLKKIVRLTPSKEFGLNKTAGDFRWPRRDLIVRSRT
jgi:hypothetical protein